MLPNMVKGIGKLGSCNFNFHLREQEVSCERVRGVLLWLKMTTLSCSVTLVGLSIKVTISRALCW